jgi:hypothetical protein
VSFSAKYHFMWFIVFAIVTAIISGANYSSPVLFILMLIAWLGTSIYMPSTGARLSLLLKFKIDAFWMLLAMSVSCLFIAIPDPAPDQTVDRSTFFILMSFVVCWKIWRDFRKLKKSSS